MEYHDFQIFRTNHVQRFPRTPKLPNLSCAHPTRRSVLLYLYIAHEQEIFQRHRTSDRDSDCNRLMLPCHEVREIANFRRYSTCESASRFALSMCITMERTNDHSLLWKYGKSR